MKRVKNLTENKVLINTFKKLKTRVYLNKSKFRKNSFFFLKFGFFFTKRFFLQKQVNVLHLSNIAPTKNLFTAGKPHLLYKTLLLFNIYIFIKFYKPTTSVQRFRKSTFLIKFKKLKSLFRFFLPNNAGRNNNGLVTVLSKSKKKKILSINSFRNNRWDSGLTNTVSIFRNKKKLLVLNKHITGSFSIRPLTQGTYLNQITFLSNLPKNFWFNKLPGSVIIIKFLTKFSIFSNIFLYDTAKYALSNGTFCQVLETFNDYNLVKISLPSKSIKFVSGWTFALLGRNAQVDFKFNRIPGAGYNRILGNKPKVRGVARNPVDHPHGGRTKTNQPEVSIWGWVAKRNK